MTTALLFALSASVLAAGPIVLDGRFGDWTDVPVTLQDPADAPEAAVDFGQVRLTHDDRYVHLLVELGRIVNVQRLNGSIELIFDADGDMKTGRTVHGLAGVDLIVELSPRDAQRPDRRGSGAALLLPIDQPPPGDRMRLSAHMIGTALAPTHAGDRIELRLERGAAFPGVDALFATGSFRGRLVHLEHDGDVADETDVFTYDVTPARPVPSDQPTDPFARAPGTQLRVVSWNTGMDGLRTKQAIFERVLHAIDPDVILLQELTEADDPQRVEAYFRAWVAPQRGDFWTVYRGRGGGRLRCAVASRLPLAPYAALDHLPMPDRPERSVRVMGAEVVVAERRLLLVSAHLRCCGQAGSFEDRTRVVEADAIRRAVAGAVASGRFDGVVVGGDVNLVGSRWPLDVLSEDLAVVEPLQLDGRSNTTWWDVRQPFLPGRLDFLLVSDPPLAVRRSFVVDTRQLAPRWLRHHGLGPGDTVEASDHLPVVVDLGGAGPRGSGR